MISQHLPTVNRQVGEHIESIDQPEQGKTIKVLFHCARLRRAHFGVCGGQRLPAHLL